MGLTHPLRSRALAIPLALLLATGALVAGPTTSASAANVPPLDLSTQALPTVQVDGVVWTQTIVGGTVYVGGNFTTARPIAGGAVGRANVLAYDLASGELLSSFVANTNGAVRSIAAAPNGSRIYIGGTFTTVNGVARNRIAALDPATGAPLRAFAPSLNAPVTGVAATARAVYAVGTFTQSNRTTVSKATALSPANGSTLAWRPAFGTGTLRAVTVSPDASVVLVGGGFTSVGGAHAGGMAALDAGSGRLLPWAASSVVDLGGAATGIYGLSTDGTFVYAAGWSYQNKWGENSLEGVVSMRWNSGAINWIEDCHGDSYSTSAMNGILYVASHAHFCGNVPNGFAEMPRNTGRRATAFSVQASGVLAKNTTQGPAYYQDFGGQPAPVLMNFFPELTPGTFTGQYQAAWSVAAANDVVAYGGEFTKVNGRPQTGLVRFAEPARSPVEAAPPTPTPTPTPTTTPTTRPTPRAAKPARVSTPNAVALGPSKIAVRWSAPKRAAADKVSGYVIKAYRGSKLAKTVTVGKTTRLATISGLSRSTTYRIGVAAKNVAGVGKLSVLDPAKTKAKGKNVSATKKPTKVKKPTASHGARSLRVKWAAASTRGALAVTKYQVRLLKAGNAAKVVTVGAKARAKLIPHLSRRTTYQVSVRAANWAGWGSWSAARSARTH